MAGRLRKVRHEENPMQATDDENTVFSREGSEAERQASPFPGIAYGLKDCNRKEEILISLSELDKATR